MIGHVVIRSRAGNLILEVLGVIYALTATVLLIYYLVQSWNAASLVDRVLQLILVAAAATGVWFFAIGRENLKQTPNRQT